MIIDFQFNSPGDAPIGLPIFQFSCPSIDTSQRQGVGGPVEAIATVKGNAGASAYVIGSSENLQP